MGTSVDRAAAGSDLYKRGGPFGIPGELVDGMDVFKVIESAHKAGKYVREGKGPYILEVQTYRYRGHSMSDPAKYRTKKELELYKAKDPIEIAHNKILQKKIATEKELEKINKETIKKMKNAKDYALKSPFPSNEDLYTDVYV
jgi:pyruvate dehydrogenase E1 component alpha subunit